MIVKTNTKDFADLIDTGSVADERSEYNVDTLLDTEAEIGLVFFRDGGQIDVGAGQVDALFAAEQTTVFDLTIEVIVT